MRLSALSEGWERIDDTISVIPLAQLPDSTRGWIDTVENDLPVHYVDDIHSTLGHFEMSRYIFSKGLARVPNDFPPSASYDRLMKLGWVPIYKYPDEIDIRTSNVDVFRRIIRTMFRADRSIMQRSVFCGDIVCRSPEELRPYLYG